jgi:hypothetical protein
MAKTRAVEDRLLFACARQAFTAEYQQRVQQLCQNERISWQRVYETATRHGVAPLIYRNLQQYAQTGNGLVPPDMMSRFKLYLARALVGRERRARRLAEVLARFNQSNIDVMLIKGAAVELLVYDKVCTTPQDLDLVLKPGREQLTNQTEALIAQLEGVGIEYDYFEHHDVTMNGVLPVDFHQIWEEAVSVTFRGQRVLVMSPEDMLISLCINSCRKRFFRLKALCDIAETVRQYRDMDWKRLQSKARKVEVTDIVYTALLATQMTLGCELPAGTLDKLKGCRVRTAVINQLLGRMSLASYDSLYQGTAVFGRNVSWQLLLPYATFRPYQIGRRLAFVCRHRDVETPNWE